MVSGEGNARNARMKFIREPSRLNFPTWRIIPVSKWIVTLMYNPIWTVLQGGTCDHHDDLSTLLNGMILQVRFPNKTLQAL